MRLGPRLFIVAAIAVVAASLAPVGAHAAESRVRLTVGAATVEVSPPKFDPKADAAAFPACPPSVFTGRRPFAFEEPYIDLDGSGAFNYPEPFCDANHNGRYDGMYISGGVDHLAEVVHDPIDARALAVSDSRHTAVIISVVAQGIHETYTHRVRDEVRARRPAITDVIVSANHNESSPDTVGIYGAPDNGVTGTRSGIDDYYMAFLVDRIADAAIAAYDRRQPATLAATQFRVPPDVRVQLSKNFPTTDDNGQPAAIDPKIGVLEARGANGTPIATVMSMAAHNQEIGHSGALAHHISSDWPGYFHRKLESLVGGVGMFLVGDNGSIEDPETVPPVSQTDHPECKDGCYAQAQATGEALARAVAANVGHATPVRRGLVSITRDEFFVPLENNLFKAAAAAGLFGERQTYLAGVPAGPVGPDLKTEVGVVRIGPDVELMTNPGESFPALMVGSHWGIEDASCPDRPNPPVPTWHADAKWRFHVGLADDLIGYLIPAWGFSTQPGAFTTTCFNDQNDKDQRGHQHKLETESVGPTAANLVAQHLTALLDRQPPPATGIRQGRWVRPDGSLSRRPEGAVGLWLADPGSTSLAPGTGTLIARPGIKGFGSRNVDVTGTFIDYDAAAQDSPDLLTHGMMVGQTRSYVDVYPSLTTSTLGGAR